MSEGLFEKRSLKISWLRDNCFQIVEQSHRGDNLFPKGYKGPFISNGIELLSKSYPEFRIDLAKLYLFTRGTSLINDTRTCSIDPTYHSAIDSAVAEYNRVFNSSFLGLLFFGEDRPIRLDMSDKKP
jgi:hypothetical protein